MVVHAISGAVGLIQDGDEIYLQLMPGQTGGGFSNAVSGDGPVFLRYFIVTDVTSGDPYVTVQFHSPSELNAEEMKFTIHKWYGSGPIKDGDELYLRTAGPIRKDGVNYTSYWVFPRRTRAP